MTDRAKAREAAAIPAEELQGILAAFDSVPCGIFNVTPWPELRIICANQGFFDITGWGREEFLRDRGGSLEAIVCPADIKKFRRTMNEQNGSPLKCQFRVTAKDGAVKWVSIEGKPHCGEDGSSFVCTMLADISKIKELEIGLREKDTLNSIAVESSDLIIWSYDITKDILTHTQKSMAAHNAQQAVRERPVEYLLSSGKLRPDCHERLQRLAESIRRGEKRVSADLWFRSGPDAEWWCERITCINVFDDSGAPAIAVGVGRNVTEEIRAKTEKQKMETAMKSASIYIWEYDLATGICHYDPPRGVGVPRREIAAPPENMIKEGRIHRDSIDEYRKLHEKIRAGVPFASADIRLFYENGLEAWVRITYHTIYDGFKAVRAVGHAKDITAEIRAQASKRQMEMALSLSSLSVWSYDIRSKVFYDTNRSFERLGMAPPFRGGCDAVIAAGIVLPESAESYRELHRRIDSGERSAGAVIHFNKALSQTEWLKITYSTIFEGDKPMMAVGIGEDVSDLMNAQRRYNEELRHQMLEDTPNLLAKIRANATKNRIESYYAKEAASTGISGLSYVEGINKIAMTAQTEEQKKEFLAAAGRESIIQDYSGSENVKRFESQRKLKDGRVVWVTYVIKTFKNPETGDILCFIYAYDIDSEKTTRTIINRIAESEFQMLSLVDVNNGMVRVHSENDPDIRYGRSTLNYTETLRGVVLPLITKEKQDEARGALSLENVVREVKRRGYYECSFPISSGCGIKHKKWRFCPLDDAGAVLLMSRSDVTELLARNMRQEELLRAALSQAEAASVAKSDFLSRMSHEIRTPMNAIIGMTALAKSAVADNAEALDYLSKADISAKFLLALINDILDMSKIESGKAVVENEPIFLPGFIENINMISRGLASRGGVRCSCRAAALGAKIVIGDAMKLRQVLLNVIANAVKFTPAGGAVSVEVSQEPPKCGRVVTKFVVRDSGIGISGKFLPNIFEPFAQEHIGNTNSYGGTGLGLAICRSLVSMMGGEITASSEEGKGTEFVITMNFGLGGRAESTEHTRSRALCPPDFDFSDKRVLLAEDHELNVIVAKKLLEKRGFKVETAMDGAEAVKLFEARGIGYYDAVLMDIRMPRMDGLTAAETIRESCGDYGAGVPIIAMSANAFTEDIQKSLASGMNMHLAKPIEPEQLYGALYELLCLPVHS